MEYVALGALITEAVKEVTSDRLAPEINDILDALIADYELRKVKSIRHSVSHLKPVRAFFGTRRALSVSPDLIRQYVEMRKSKG